MGRRDRERIARIEAGQEEPVRNAFSPTIRKAISFITRGSVVKELRNASTEDQIGVLQSTVPGNKMKDAITRAAPGEMDKAIRKFQKEGKEVTVDTLCAEIKSTPGFLAMCTKAGLDLAWFEDLARKRMEAHGL